MIKKINHGKVKEILTEYLAKNFDELVGDCNCLEVVTFVTGDESFLIDYHGFLVELHFFNGLNAMHYAGSRGVFYINKESTEILSNWSDDDSKRKSPAKKSFMFNGRPKVFKSFSFDVGIIANIFNKP